MLRRDHELRLSAAVQRRYAACGDDGVAKERVTQAVQRQVAVEAGFTGSSTHEGVATLQGALALFPDGVEHAELKEAAFYLKHNVNVPCPIARLATVPLALRLHECTGTAGTALRSLGELCAQAPLTVLAAGSAT